MGLVTWAGHLNGDLVSIHEEVGKGVMQARMSDTHPSPRWTPRGQTPYLFSYDFIPQTPDLAMAEGFDEMLPP